MNISSELPKVVNGRSYGRARNATAEHVENSSPDARFAPARTTARRPGIRIDDLHPVDATHLLWPYSPVVGTDAIWRGGLRLERVGSLPARNQYTITGTTVVVGPPTLDPSEVLVGRALYKQLTALPKIGVIPSRLSSTVYQLPEVPERGSVELTVYGFGWRRVTGALSLGLFDVSVDLLGLGFPLDVAASIWARYFVPGIPPLAWTVQGVVDVIGPTTIQFPVPPIVDSESVFVAGQEFARVGSLPPGTTPTYTMTSATTADLGTDVSDGRTVFADWFV